MSYYKESYKEQFIPIIRFDISACMKQKPSLRKNEFFHKVKSQTKNMLQRKSMNCENFARVHKTT